MEFIFCSQLLRMILKWFGVESSTKLQREWNIWSIFHVLKREHFFKLFLLFCYYFVLRALPNILLPYSFKQRKSEQIAQLHISTNLQGAKPRFVDPQNVYYLSIVLVDLSKYAHFAVLNIRWTSLQFLLFWCFSIQNKFSVVSVRQQRQRLFSCHTKRVNLLCIT